jgi:hypothetical protein
MSTYKTNLCDSFAALTEHSYPKNYFRGGRRNWAVNIAGLLNSSVCLQDTLFPVFAALWQTAFFVQFCWQMTATDCGSQT